MRCIIVIAICLLGSAPRADHAPHAAATQGRRYTYAAYPLPNNPSFVMQAVAEVVSGQATLASCARRYPVSDKTIRKGVRNYISGEVVQLGRRGPKTAVDDGKIAAWLEAQRKASLSSYKYVHVTRLAVYSSVQQCQVYCVLHRAEVVEEAVKMALEH